MKKTILFAAAVAALISCNKGETANETSFQKGQKVILNITAQTTDSRVSTTLTPGTGAVDFKWEDKDTVLVTIGGSSSEFVLVSGAGTNIGAFSGIMPGSGDSFTAQYPAQTPDLAAQTWISGEALPHKKMLLKGNGSVNLKTFQVSAASAGLRLNLYGNQTIGKIVVTPTDSKIAPMTLTIKDGVALKEAKADSMAFILAVPAGSYGFTAEVFDNSATPVSLASFSTTKDQTFTAGNIRNMPAKEVKKAADYYPGTTLEGIEIGGVTWAPVNCGYDASHPYGLLYQWGRKDGQGYNDVFYQDADYPGKEGGIQTISTGPIASSAEVATVFYKVSSSPFDWLNPTNDARWNSGSEESPVKVTSNDPCPTGWRVPTKTELETLYGENEDGWTTDVDGQTGSYYNGTDLCTSGTSGAKVFLPAAGIRNFETGEAYNRGSIGYYWSSSVTDGITQPSGYAWNLEVDEEFPQMNLSFRAFGLSVRCVQE